MSPARTVFALDLDQTLIFSRRSAGLDPEVTPVVWVEDYAGAPLSMMTEGAHALLTRIAGEHDVVACTTRTIAQLSRVRLPGANRFAICANGGIVLRDGQRDREWDARVAVAVAASAPVEQVHDWLSSVTDVPWVTTLATAEGLFCYVVATRRDAISAGWLEEVTGWAQEHHLTVSAQGRKVYLVPAGLTKGAAARWLADALGARLLAAGDSLLDLSLLRAADVAVRPPHGELSDPSHQHLLPPAARVVGEPGAAGTHALLTALLDAARTPAHRGERPPRPAP